MATQTKEKPKAKKASGKKQSETETALRKQVDEMFPGILVELDAVLAEVREVPGRLDKLQKEISAARKDITATRKSVNKDIDLHHEEEELEIDDDAGRLKRMALKGVNLLPRSRRERGQFAAGVFVGATTNIFVPIGVLVASIARGRVVVSS